MKVFIGCFIATAVALYVGLVIGVRQESERSVVVCKEAVSDAVYDASMLTCRRIFDGLKGGETNFDFRAIAGEVGARVVR